jgi:hypothetical protein
MMAEARLQLQKRRRRRRRKGGTDQCHLQLHLSRHTIQTGNMLRLEHRKTPARGPSGVTEDLHKNQSSFGGLSNWTTGWGTDNWASAWGVDPSSRNKTQHNSNDNPWESTKKEGSQDFDSDFGTSSTSIAPVIDETIEASLSEPEDEWSSLFSSSSSKQRRRRRGRAPLQRRYQFPRHLSPSLR